MHLGAYKNSRQSGVSIVESLVALVVMSIGMLGIAGLYVESVRANRTALIRTQAVHLVNDLADRIRANRGGREAYALAKGATLPVAANCAGADCTPPQLARYDLATWGAHVRETLPSSSNPQMEVTYTAGDPARYTVWVSWVEPGDPNPWSCQVEVQQSGAI